MDEPTQRATAHAVEYQVARPVSAKGKARPIPSWVVVAAKGRPARRATSMTRLVGREAELNRLRELWEGVRTDGRAAAAVVVGPPGIGKSRLLVEFSDSARAVGSVNWGRCLAYGEGITYWPIAEALKRAAGILQSDDPVAVPDKVARLLEVLGRRGPDEVRTMTAALAHVMGVTASPDRSIDDSEITQAELHWGIRQVLRLLAARKPLLLVVEDLHWAEPTLVDLIGHIADAGFQAPILVLASARTDLSEPSETLWSGDNRLVIELGALGDKDSRTLLDQLPGADKLSSDARDSLLRAAGGNPLFLEEELRMLADIGWLQPESSAADRENEWIPVPETLQSLIGARLDQLPTRERLIAQSASVVGSVFWPGAVAHLEHGGDDLFGGLEGLERRGLVHRREKSTVTGEQEYAFKHILIRDATYGRLPKGRRAELHIRFGEWVSGLPGGGEDLVEILAYHLEQACRLARQVEHSPVAPPVASAVQALGRAADKAERREGMREADRFCARALEILGEQEAAVEMEIRLRRARILTSWGDLQQACDQLWGMEERAEALARPDLHCAALVALANVDQKQGRPHVARDRLSKAEVIAAEVGDLGLQVRVGYEFAELRGDFDGAEEAAVADLRQALESAEKVGDRPLRIEGHLRLGFLLMSMGHLTDAEKELMRCSKLAEELGSFRDEARVTHVRALVQYYLGDREESKRLGLQAREWLERTCDSYFLVQNLVLLAAQSIDDDDPVTGEQCLRSALPFVLEQGGWLLVDVYRFMTEALARQGRMDEARELLRSAHECAPEEDSLARAAVLLAEACVATEDGEATVALECFAQAMRVFEAQNSPIQLAEARVALGRALRRFGDRSPAETELRRARAEFESMGARGPLPEIDRELGLISPRSRHVR